MDFKFAPPVQKESNLFAAWVADTFKRIEQAFKNHQDERKGVRAVTGSVTIVTGLAKVQYCQASFNGNPSIAAISLACRPSATPGAIDINVYALNIGGGTLVLSSVSVNVNWVAYGF